MGNQQARGLTRLINACRYSQAGYRDCYRHEEAFRQEVWASLLFIPLAIWLGENGLERALMMGSWLLVLIVELLNSSVEAVVDRIGTEHHVLAGRAKDIASAAVSTSLLLAAAVWLLLLLPRWV